MTTANNPNGHGKLGEVRKPDPNDAATDPRDAARQEQIKRDHDALEDSRRRVERSVNEGSEKNNS